MLGQDAACIRNANNQGASAPLHRLSDGHIGNAHIRFAFRHPQLRQAPITPPIDNALRRFRRELIVNVAEKEEVGMADFHDALSGLAK
jgi:hypothetical protein